MTERRELSAPAILLLAFGVAPWLDVGIYLLAERVVGRVSRSDAEALQIGVAVSVLVGLLGAVVAFAFGVFAALREHRARREHAAAAGDGPLRSISTARTSSTVARGASLVAVVGLWGPFGIAMLEPLLTHRRGFLWSDASESWFFAVVTVASAIAGAVLLIRGRRQRAT